MKTLLLIFLLIINFKICFADDTAVSSYGGNLICSKETRISLKKEILIFTQLEKSMRVDVIFEFFNPDEARDLSVGFVTPGVSSPELPSGGQPNLKNFLAIVNEELVEFKISKIENTEFKKIVQNNFDNDFIYLFDVRFNKGLNTIKHSYNFEPIFSSGGSFGSSEYNYKLTTGKNWANEEIEDFELIINKTGLFDVPLYLDDNHNNWEIKGFGKQKENVNQIHPNESTLTVNLKSGYLYFHKTSFKPTYDIKISRFNPIDSYELLQIIYWSSMNGGSGLDKLNKNDYRLARNAVFATYGYKFKDYELLNYFSNYVWYIPDPNVMNTTAILDYQYKELYDRIVKLETEFNDK